MILPIIVFSTLGILFADSILHQPPRKSPERQLGDALTNYLESVKKKG